jgi:hypothetical protein
MLFELPTIDSLSKQEYAPVNPVLPRHPIMPVGSVLLFFDTQEYSGFLASATDSSEAEIHWPEN